MKLADLKKLPVGTKLRCVHNARGPCDLPRTVLRVQTTGLYFAGPVEPGGEDKETWLMFPKASGFRDDGDGFTLTQGAVSATYKFVREEAAPDDEPQH